MEEVGLEISEEWILTFHGVSYIILLLCSNHLLSLEIENEESGERWSGEFTSQYIEEITHKAGNFKKFSVFAKMLSSSFSKTNESVHIDILTLSDLELLKAQKIGKNGSHSTTTSSMNGNIKNLNASIAHHLKRYAILTYTGEFDRVHYPLPLAFEEQPNFPALQRNLRRLRLRVKEQEQVAAGPSSEKEKELRQMVSQLRLENTELKHKLRQFTSRTLRDPQSNQPSNTELHALNTKLKQQVEKLTKDLDTTSENFERHRKELTKEIVKWKAKAAGGGTSTVDLETPSTKQHTGKIHSPLSASSSPSTAYAHYQHHPDDLAAIASLKRQLTALSQETRVERLARGMPSTESVGSQESIQHLRSTSASKRTSMTTSFGATSRSGSANSRSGASGRASSSPQMKRSSGGDWNNSIAVHSLSIRASTPPIIPPSSSSSGTHSATKRAWVTSQNTRESSSRTRGATTSSSSFINSRSTTPTTPQRKRSTPNRSRSASPTTATATSHNASSTLGKPRFDPTAYQLQKLQHQILTKHHRPPSPSSSASPGKPWGSGPGSSSSTTAMRQHRYPHHGEGNESGYSSAGSQGSRRSLRSGGHTSDGSASTTGSGTKKIKPKKVTKKSSSHHQTTAGGATAAATAAATTTTAANTSQWSMTRSNPLGMDDLQTLRHKSFLPPPPPNTATTAGAAAITTKNATTSSTHQQQQHHTVQKAEHNLPTTKRKGSTTKKNSSSAAKAYLAHASEEDSGGSDREYNHPDDLPLPSAARRTTSTTTTTTTTATGAVTKKTGGSHNKLITKESKQLSVRMDFPTGKRSTLLLDNEDEDDDEDEDEEVLQLEKKFAAAKQKKQQQQQQHHHVHLERVQKSSMTTKKGEKDEEDEEEENEEDSLVLDDKNLLNRPLPSRPYHPVTTTTATAFSSDMSKANAMTTARSSLETSKVTTTTTSSSSATAGAASTGDATGGGGNSDISAIDRRIKELEAYLNNARVGIVSATSEKK